MAGNPSRRQVLKTLGAAGGVALAGCAQDGDTTATDGGATSMNGTTGSSDASGTVTIGALQPMSGDLQYYGQQSMWGFLSGLAYKADSDPPGDVTPGEITVSVGDVDYEILLRDTQFAANAAESAATTLVQNDDVDMLFGCSSSSAARRVITNILSQVDIPYVAGPAASAALTSSSETCGENVFRANENTAMDARSGGRYVATETDVSKVYLFGADYAFGRAVVNNYRTVLEANGVEIVGERLVERGFPEWDGLLDNAQQKGAEGIVGGFTVQTLPKLFNSFLSGDYSYRLFGGFATRFTNRIVGGTLKSVLGEDFTAEDVENAKLGPFTTRYHWNQYDNPINDAFVDSYTSAYGVVPDLFTSGTFTAASAIHQAVTESGSTAGADIAGALRGMTVTDTPKGENGYEFQTYNNQARSEMTVANPIPTTDEWADSWGAAIQPSEPVARIGADQVTIPADSDDMNCSL